MTIAPFGWKDGATPTTAPPTGGPTLSAANLEAMHAAAGGYADSLNSTLTAAAVTASGSDTLGRTQVIGTPSIAAPSLRQFAFVDDAPWGAAGDAQRLTDGAITISTNQLSSVSYTFTNADVGKRVCIVGAATQVGVGLFAYIGTVTGGAANLVTTHGGSTPANATASVTGATVTFGTDDTTAVNSAHTALSAAGGGTIGLTVGKSYMLTQATPTSNVTVMAYGATIYFIGPSSNYGFFSSGTVTNWSIRGARIPGDSGAWTPGTFVPIWFSGGNATDIGVFDCKITGHTDCAINLTDVPRARVMNNDIINCCKTSGRNAVNLGATTANLTMSDVVVHGNYFQDIVTWGLNLGTSGGITQSVNSFRTVVTGNRFKGTMAIGIGVEAGSSGAGGGEGEVIVANNIMNLTSGVAAGAQAIVLINSTINTGRNASMVVQGNRITSDGTPIQIQAGDVTCTGNEVNITSVATIANGIAVVGANQTVTATTDGSTAVLTSVTVLPGTSTPVPNGTPVSGTGIPTGSWLVSGAGTATWTISQNTTSPNTDETVTCTVAYFNVNIVANVIHFVAQTTLTNTTGGLMLQNLANSHVADNVVYYDPGSTVNSGYGLYWSGSYNVDVDNNRIMNAPRYGTRMAGALHDCQYTRNKVYNSAQNSADFSVSMSAACYNMILDRNVIWDDNSSSHMTTGINTSGGNIRVTGNVILGWTSSPIAGSGTIEVSDNRFTYGPPNGRATLSGGTVTVTTTEIRTGDNVILSRQTQGAAPGYVSVGTITANTSFTIVSSSGTDTGIVSWRIDH